MHQSELKPQVHAQNSQQTSERTKRTAENIVMNSKEGVIMKRRMCARSTTESKRQRENEHELNKAHTHTNGRRNGKKERKKKLRIFSAFVLPFRSLRCAQVLLCVCVQRRGTDVSFSPKKFVIRIRSRYSLFLLLLDAAEVRSSQCAIPIRISCPAN